MVKGSVIPGFNLIMPNSFLSLNLIHFVGSQEVTWPIEEIRLKVKSTYQQEVKDDQVDHDG